MDLFPKERTLLPRTLYVTYYQVTSVTLGPFSVQLRF